MNSYDIIQRAVIDYAEDLNKHGQPVDYAYIVHFYQSYDPVKDFKECTEIVYYNYGEPSVEFEMDFCEGEQYVTDIEVIALYEVGRILKCATELEKKLKETNLDGYVEGFEDAKQLYS